MDKGPPPSYEQPGVILQQIPHQPIVHQVQASVTHGITPTINYGPKSQNAICPNCRNAVLTKTRTKATTKTHLWACCLCYTTCLLCSCLPYCMSSCVNTNHYCPNCNNFLGTYRS